MLHLGSVCVCVSVCVCHLQRVRAKEKMEIQSSKSNNREWAEMRDERMRERGRGWRRGRVDSRTLGNESAALVMKWTDRESLRGWREEDGEDSRSWSQNSADVDERYFSHVGAVCLSAENIIYFSLLVDYDTQEAHHSKQASCTCYGLKWYCWLHL